MLTALIGPVAGLLRQIYRRQKIREAKLAHEIATMSEKHAHELSKEQAKANTAAAKHPSMFVGWEQDLQSCGCVLLVCL